MNKAQAQSPSLLNIQQFQKENDDFGKYLDDLLNEHEQEGEQNKKVIADVEVTETYDLNSVQLTSIDQPPFEIKFQEEIGGFLAHNVLRPVADKTASRTLKTLLFSKGTVKLLRQLFWAVILHKFPQISSGEENLKLLLLLRKKISRTYLKLFTVLPKENDDLVNIFVFSVIYIIHYSMHKYLPLQRKLFSARFILDCYHIGLFELNGILVSDFYIQQSFEKVFLPTFLMYDSDEPLKIKFEPSNLRLLPDKEIPASVSSLLSTSPRGIPQPWSLVEFRKELTNTLHPRAKKEGLLFATSKQGGLVSLATGGVVSSSQLSGKLPKANGVLSQSTGNLNLKKVGASRKPVASKRVIDLENEEENKGDFYLTEVRSDSGSFKGSYKFNCSQISPTISSMLEKESMSLPYTQRKLMNYTMDKADSKSDLLHVINYLKEEKAHKKLKDTHIQKEKMHKKNNLEAYGLSRVWEDDQGKYSKYLKNQQELRYILDNTQQNLTDLPSFKKYRRTGGELFFSRSVRENVEVAAKSQEIVEDKTQGTRQTLKILFEGPNDSNPRSSVISVSEKKQAQAEKLPRINTVHTEGDEKLTNRSEAPINDNVRLSRKLDHTKTTVSSIKDDAEASKKTVEYFSDDAIDKMVPIEGMMKKKVGLLQFEQEFEKKETKLYDRDEIRYKNKRKDYKKRFTPMFSDDTDVNISNLIHNILQKKSNITKSLNSMLVKK